ncbi:serine/threonine-protein kinase [Kitasatospora sp. NPDC101176]|uniref:serine/threonine-protein kinase n=1 Tax=Kitasatospora sp. NPDC101176 TaxID=3364099 RepID=UPI00382092E4
MRALGSDDPRQVGAYRLLRRLGAGGMGRVYLGRTAGGRTVAVKVVRSELADDAEFRARFRQEVAAARRVGGAWTAPVLDADTEGEHPWVATGYVAGPALATAVRDSGPLPEPAVRALGVGLAEALAHVHGLGLVHRDVKPSNVLLTLDGPRLIDFGIARALDATSGFTQSGYVVGSPGFMSPEQASGRPVGPAGDVFSLGAVLAFAATGVHPFGEGVSAAVLLYRVLHEEPDVAGLTGPLRALVLDCLAKDPAARPTPARLRERLDPDGGATALLGHGGWLPPALAAAVGRSAVELLDLEGDPDVGGPPDEPVPTPTYVPRGHYPPLGQHPPAPVTPLEPGRPGRPGQRGRRRAGRAAAAVLAVALLAGAGYGLYAWTHRPDPAGTAPTTGPLAVPSVDPGRSGASPGASGEGGADGPSDPSAAASPAGRSGPPAAPATAPASGAGGTGGPSAVPAAFLGTWRGDMVSDKGLPAGTTTLTIGPAAIGQENTTSRNAFTGLIPLSCDGAWTLKSASGSALVFTSRLVRSSLPGACTSGSYAETLTLQADGTIRFTSADPAAGNPAGTMRRVDGTAG